MNQLFITSLSSSGEGIGTLDGLKIFVDGALPGETVEVEILSSKKNYATAKLLSILKPSPDRVKPPCPLFGTCGGCQVMHASYSAQLSLKRQRVTDSLKHIGGFQDLNVENCLPSPSPLGYRNKIQLPVVWDQHSKSIGLYRKQTHEIIPVSRCLIQSDQGGEILLALIEKLAVPSVRYILLRNAVINKEAMVILVTDGTFSNELTQFAEELIQSNPLIKGVVENINTRNDNVILGPHFRTLAGRGWIFESLLGKTFKIAPNAFFQVNSFQTEKLYELALRMADIQSDEVVLDAYCGVGTLAIFAEEKASHVIGIECVDQAVQAARENAVLNQAAKCRFLCGQAERLIGRIKKCDAVFLNPPRKGCQEALLQSLLKQKPKKIVYISCDPATLARDLRCLVPSYKIDYVQPVDMFPQTMHVETIARLTLA